MTGPEKMRRAESLATVLRGSQQSAVCNPDDARLTTLLDRLLFLTEPLSAGCGVYDSNDDRHNQTKRGVLLLGKATTFGNNILTYNQRAGAPRETVEREAATRSSPD